MESSAEKKKILCIVSSMDTGGAETFLMKVYRAIDKDLYQMDFYCMSQEKGYYEEEIRSMGGEVFHSYPKSKNFIKSFVSLKKTVEKYNYECVMRVSQHSLATIDLLASKFGGAKILVMRSSNADSGSTIGKFLHKLFKWMPKIIPTLKIAPSVKAAEYTFGKGCVDKGEVLIINNAIPVEQFTFNFDKRNKIRHELEIDGKFVVGHIGRLTRQKNHDFLIDVFREIKNRKENSILLLVGKGELEHEIKSKIKRLNLMDNVMFLGVRDDIPEILMSMDVFIFPSFYEGMPNTVIEAQATGLPCIISDTITKEANITGDIEYLSINDSAESWAIKALSYSHNSSRGNMNKKFIEKGYDINYESQKLVDEIFNPIK